MKKLTVIAFTATFFMLGCEKPNSSIPEEDPPASPQEAFERRVRSGGKLDKSNVLFDKQTNIIWENSTRLSDSLILFALDIKDSVVLSQGNGRRILMNNRIFLLAELKDEWMFSISSLFPNPAVHTQHYSGTMLKQGYFSSDVSYSNFYDGYPIVALNGAKIVAIKGNRSSLVSKWVTTCTSVNAYVNGVYKGSTTTCNQTWEYEPVGEWQVPQPELGGEGGSTVIYVDEKEEYDSEEDYFNAHINDLYLADCMKAVLETLKKLEGNSVADVIKRFSGEVPGYHVSMAMAQLENPMVAGFARMENNRPVIFMNSNRTTVEKASDLAVAATMLHESIHAYLLAYFKNDPDAAELQYPELFTRYAKRPEALNGLHHTIIGQNYVADLAKPLKNYGEINNYNLEEQVYKDLVWKGLTNGDSESFNALDSISRKRIERRIMAEQYDSRDTITNIKQLGKKLGC